MTQNISSNPTAKNQTQLLNNTFRCILCSAAFFLVGHHFFIYFHRDLYKLQRIVKEDVNVFRRRFSYIKPPFVTIRVECRIYYQVLSQGKYAVTWNHNPGQTVQYFTKYRENTRQAQDKTGGTHEVWASMSRNTPL